MSRQTGLNVVLPWPRLSRKDLLELWLIRVWRSKEMPTNFLQLRNLLHTGNGLLPCKQPRKSLPNCPERYRMPSANAYDAGAPSADITYRCQLDNLTVR